MKDDNDSRDPLRLCIELLRQVDDLGFPLPQFDVIPQLEDDLVLYVDDEEE